MKKIAIIAAIVLTTGLTAFSLSKKETAKAEVKIEAASNNATQVEANLATAD